MTTTTASPRREAFDEPVGSERWRWRVELLWLVVTMTAAVLIAAVVLRLWNGGLHVPIFGIAGDTTFSLMVVKDTISSPWMQSNDLLGAPFGQNLLDFATLSADNLQFAVIKALGFFSDDVAAVTNAFYMLTFALTAGTAYVVMRGLAVSRYVAAVCGVLFAVLPFHFMRGEAHLFLAGYEAVPLGAFLVLSILLGVRRLPRHGRSLGGWWNASAGLTLLACVVIGSASVYYATFTVLLLLLAAPLAAIAARDRTRLFEGLALVALIVGVLAINLTPNLVYRAVNGVNPLVAQRLPMESEIYSLNLAQLTMPVEGHYLKPLAELRQRYLESTPLPSGAMAALGTVATIGLVVGVVLVLAGALGGRRPRGRLQVAQAAGLAGLLAFIIGTTGGLSALIAYLITAQVRAWDRISVFIAFFALVVIAALLDLLRRRLAVRPRGALLAGAAVTAVAVVGVLDQTGTAFDPDHVTARAEWANDARFVNAIEQRLPDDAEVFQLPYMAFPEVPPLHGMSAYDLARGYLHSDRLRFSYGAMSGRDADWSGALADAAPDDVIASAAAAGFQGLWIDRAGYADQGAALEAVVRKLTGQQPLVSENGRLAFYDLRPYAAGLRERAGASAVDALGQATLDPVEIGWGTGFYPPETAGTSVYRWMGANAGLTLTADAPRSVVVAVDVASDEPGTLTVNWPDGTTQTLRTGTKPVELRRTMALREGQNPVTLTTDAAITAARVPGDERDLRVRIADPVVTSAEALPALLAD